MVRRCKAVAAAALAAPVASLRAPVAHCLTFCVVLCRSGGQKASWELSESQRAAACRSAAAGTRSPLQEVIKRGEGALPRAKCLPRERFSFRPTPTQLASLLLRIFPCLNAILHGLRRLGVTGVECPGEGCPSPLSTHPAPRQLAGIGLCGRSPCGRRSRRGGRPGQRRRWRRRLRQQRRRRWRRGGESCVTSSPCAVQCWGLVLR